MKRSLVVSFLALTVATTLTACGSANAPDASLGEAELTSKTRLDVVTPAEVADTYSADLAPALLACIAGNPHITNVDLGNLNAFYRPGVASHWNVWTAVKALLAEPGVTSIPVAELATRIHSWAESQM
jgi:hypothetical protein